MLKLCKLYVLRDLNAVCNSVHPLPSSRVVQPKVNHIVAVARNIRLLTDTISNAIPGCNVQSSVSDVIQSYESLTQAEQLAYKVCYIFPF